MDTLTKLPAAASAAHALKSVGPSRADVGASVPSPFHLFNVDSIRIRAGR